MLDLGQYFELDNYTNEEIINKIFNKFDLINLNERVEKYLYNRFSVNTLNDLYNLLNPAFPFETFLGHFYLFQFYSPIPIYVNLLNT